MPHELIRPSEYARRRGVSAAAVSKAIKRCRIPLIDGKLDPLVADTLWEARTDPDQARRAMAQNVRSHPGAEAGMEEPADWRARRERAEAQLAELELAEREGTLVKAAEVQRIISRFLAGLRTQFESIPDRIAAEFGVDDAHRRRIRDRIREELDQIRTELVIAGRLKEQ